MGKFKHLGFTLAEVLITLGIIGVVAALTLPTLISKYQKQVYYNQFLKAVSVLENAGKLYINDYCGGDASNCYFGIYSSYGTPNPDFYKDFSKYFKVIKEFNSTNYEDVCSGYTKLPISQNLDGSNRDFNACTDAYSYSGINPGGNYGFITVDGMMFNLWSTLVPADGGLVDINGPDKGPNIFGRDVFNFIFFKGNSYSFVTPGVYRPTVFGIYWDTQTYMENAGYSMNAPGYYVCPGVNFICGERLLKEGKMNY